MKLKEARKILNQQLKVMKTIPPKAKWEELTQAQQAVFKDKLMVGMMNIFFLRKCPSCKRTFKEPLCGEKTGWNAKFLFHLSETHGWGGLENIMRMIRKTVLEGGGE